MVVVRMDGVVKKRAQRRLNVVWARYMRSSSEKYGGGVKTSQTTIRRRLGTLYAFIQ
jgi:hypothetical protein